jgi:lysophospholipase L1-like esterase
MNWETILSFGDSITIGSRTYLGYPECSSAILQQKMNIEWNVFNFAKSGITSVELHRMIANSFADLKQTLPELITIMVGTNDAKKGTSIDNFEIAYRQVLLKARLIAPEASLILFSIPMLRKGVKLPYTLDMNHTIEQYNIVIKKLSESFRVTLLEPVLEDHLFIDGVHLNEEGVMKMGEYIANYVFKVRGLSFLQTTDNQQLI